MRKRQRRSHDSRLRVLVVALTLFCHGLVTFGFPLPALSKKTAETSYPFPCQSRPCGCSTSEECWKGDCCCFTLEEKLAWADAHDIQPPAHVRALVASRTAQKHEVKRKSCCCAAEGPTGQPESGQAISSSGKNSGELCADVNDVCDHHDSGGRSREQDASEPTSRVAVRWIIGLSAQKCRGEGPAGLIPMDLSTADETAAIAFVDAPVVESISTGSDRAAPRPISPPIPPPRIS